MMVVIDYTKCRKCGGEMIKSTAIAQPFIGSPDFGGEDGTQRGATLNPCTTGPGQLIECMKCSACGWSVKIGVGP